MMIVYLISCLMSISIYILYFAIYRFYVKCEIIVTQTEWCLTGNTKSSECDGRNIWTIRAGRFNVKWALRQPHLLLIFNLNSAHDTRKIGESAFHVVPSHVGLDPYYIGERVTSNSGKEKKNRNISFFIPLCCSRVSKYWGKIEKEKRIYIYILAENLARYKR